MGIPLLRFLLARIDRFIGRGGTGLRLLHAWKLRTISGKVTGQSLRPGVFTGPMPDGFLAGYIGVNIRINTKQCNVNVEPNSTATEK